MLAPQLAADAQVQSQRILDFLLEERFFDRDARKLGRESRVAAMVAPVSVQNPQFGLVGVAPLAAEVAHHLAQVVGVHGEPVPLAIRLQVGVLHGAEALQHFDRPDLGLLHVAEHGEVLFARFDGIDIITADFRQLGVAHVGIEQQQLRRTDAHIGRRVDQPHAVDRRRGPLVELPGQELDGDILVTAQIALLAHGVGDHLAEDGIAAFFEQLRAEAEQVVDVQQPQRAERQPQIGIQFAPQALGFDPEARQFLDENTVVFHYGCFSIGRIFRPSGLRSPPHRSPRTSHGPSCVRGGSRSCRRGGRRPRRAARPPAVRRLRGRGPECSS